MPASSSPAGTAAAGWPVRFHIAVNGQCQPAPFKVRIAPRPSHLPTVGAGRAVTGVIKTSNSRNSELTRAATFGSAARLRATLAAGTSPPRRAMPRVRRSKRS